MIPHLTYRGRLVLAAALLLLFAGAALGTPPLVELAGAIVVALLALHLMFYPTAILLRRKKVELSWWVPPGDQPGGALAVERPFSLHIAFRNHGSRRLRILSTRVFHATGLAIDDRPSATVERGQQVELVTAVRPLAAGHHVLHGAALTFADGWNLFSIEAFFPNPIAVKVFPRTLPLRGRSARAGGGALHEQVGLHTVKRRGLAGQLRELRDHTHGDPFKFIAWKASARRRRLMVRDLENEIVTAQMILVDVGSGMRQGSVGATPLDWACDVAAALGRAAIHNGDRVGLVGYDTRPIVELGAGTGHHHYLRLVDRLLDSRSVVDADLTDVTAGELVAVVARYLAHQEAVDVRVRTPPPLSDPRWAHIQAGPDGQLYDVAVTAKLCNRFCDAVGKTTQPVSRQPTAYEDAQLLSLRRFCRLRGIELPYRMSWEYGMRAAGLAAAAERATGKTRPDIVVLVSDLVGLCEDEIRTTRALARLGSAAGKVVAIVPEASAFLPIATTDYGRRVRDLLIADHQAATEPGRRLLRRHGVTILEGSPAASLDRLLHKPRAA